MTHTPSPALPPAASEPVGEQELSKVLVKIWGYKWVEFEDIPLPGAEGRDRIADAYSTRLNAQDAARGLLRRYTIRSLAAPPQVEPAEDVAELVFALNSAHDPLRKRGLYAEAAAAIASLDRRLNEEQMQTTNGGEIITELRAELLSLRRKVEETEAERDEWKASHGRVVEGFMEVCEAVGVQFDAPEAVAYAINTKIGNAENDKRAAERKVEGQRKALEPFAAARGHFDSYVRDEDTVDIALRHIRAHHVRAAARALGEQP